MKKNKPSNVPVPPTAEEWAQKMKELSKPKPIYTPSNVKPVSKLHYDATVWTSGKKDFPVGIENVIEQIVPAWEKDGLHIEKFIIRKDKLQILFFARYDVSPITFAARIKGRLQYALRNAGIPVKFSRKVSFRSLGDNISAAVTGYLRKQAKKEGFVDQKFVKQMEKYTIVQEDINLANPAVTSHGRYWYNLHIVIVTGGRRQFAYNEPLEKLRDGCVRIAAKKGYRLKSVAVMLEHVHIALGGCPDYTPEEIALSFMNNLSWIMGHNRIWQDGYYVGSFSEYALKDL